MGRWVEIRGLRSCIAGLAAVVLVALTAHDATAGFCQETGVSDDGDYACRDSDGVIVGVGRLFTSGQIRANLVSGRGFGAIGVEPNGQFNFDCNVFDDTRDGFPAVVFSEGCFNAETFLMQGF